MQLDKHLDEKAEASSGKSSDDSSAHGDCEEDEQVGGGGERSYVVQAKAQSHR